MAREADEARLRAINPRRWELMRRSTQQFLLPEEKAELVALQKEMAVLVNRLHPLPLLDTEKLEDLGKKIGKARKKDGR